jgi:hypothetical protein
MLAMLRIILLVCSLPPQAPPVSETGLQAATPETPSLTDDPLGSIMARSR